MMTANRSKINPVKTKLKKKRNERVHLHHKLILIIRVGHQEIKVAAAVAAKVAVLVPKW